MKAKKYYDLQHYQDLRHFRQAMGKAVKFSLVIVVILLAYSFVELLIKQGG